MELWPRELGLVCQAVCRCGEEACGEPDTRAGAGTGLRASSTLITEVITDNAGVAVVPPAQEGLGRSG